MFMAVGTACTPSIICRRTWYFVGTMSLSRNIWKPFPSDTCAAVMCRRAVQQLPSQAGFVSNFRESGACGWRRSVDRTRLRVSSLLTGNLTGKIGISALWETILEQKAAAPQRLVG
jgi:hypothetical protein